MLTNESVEILFALYKKVQELDKNGKMFSDGGKLKDLQENENIELMIDFMQMNIVANVLLHNMQEIILPPNFIGILCKGTDSNMQKPQQVLDLLRVTETILLAMGYKLD